MSEYELVPILSVLNSQFIYLLTPDTTVNELLAEWKSFVSSFLIYKMRLLKTALIPRKGFHKFELDCSIKLIDQRFCVTLMP